MTHLNAMRHFHYDPFSYFSRKTALSGRFERPRRMSHGAAQHGDA